MLNKVKSKFQNLNPNHKRYLIIGGLVIGVGGVIFTMNSGDRTSSKRNATENNIRTVLTSRDTRNMSIEALSADLNTTKRTIHEINTQIAQLSSTLERTRNEVSGNSPAIQNEIIRLQQATKTLEDDIKYLRTEGISIAGQASGSDVFTTTGGDDEYELESFEPIDPIEQELGSLNNVFQTNEFDQMSQSGSLPVQSGVGVTAPMPVEGSERIEQESGFAINTYHEYNAEDEAAEAEAKQKEKEKRELMYLPSGSILTGVFINGLDAPTGQGARRDPFPAALRIQHEAILPNHFRADIRECFLLVSGYGELSSERAYLRGETLSCVRNDGGVVETKLNSYAVGEDGKAGVKGRLVSKQGQLIARSLVAGFLSGASEAFDVNPIPVLSTSSTGSTQMESRGGWNSDFWQSAGVKGASSAMEKIADYYLEMAEGIFPVIEIVSGRQVDIIVTQGTQLRLRSKN